MSEETPVYRELPSSSVENMEGQRSFVAELADRHLLKKITGTKADYDLIQEIVRQKLIKEDETWKLQEQS